MLPTSIASGIDVEYSSLYAIVRNIFYLDMFKDHIDNSKYHLIFFDE